MHPGWPFRALSRHGRKKKWHNDLGYDPKKMPKKSPNKRGGRQAFEPTDEQRKQVKNAAGFGLRDQDIATLLGVSESTIQKYFSDELKAGRADGKQKLAKTAMQMATSGAHPTMTIFMSKVHLGWKEQHQEQQQPQSVTFNFVSEARPARYTDKEKNGTTDEE